MRQQYADQCRTSSGVASGSGAGRGLPVRRLITAKLRLGLWNVRVWEGVAIARVSQPSACETFCLLFCFAGLFGWLGCGFLFVFSLLYYNLTYNQGINGWGCATDLCQRQKERTSTAMQEIRLQWKEGPSVRNSDGFILIKKSASYLIASLVRVGWGERHRLYLAWETLNLSGTDHQDQAGNQYFTWKYNCSSHCTRIFATFPALLIWGNWLFHWVFTRIHHSWKSTGSGSWSFCSVGLLVCGGSNTFLIEVWSMTEAFQIIISKHNSC